LKIVVNGRFLTQPVTGVQRFAIEIVRALINSGHSLQVVAPRGVQDLKLAEEFDVQYIGGSIRGYLWEQLVLPFYCKAQEGPVFLINLTNTAPVVLKQQLVTIHDIATFTHPEFYSKKFVLVYRVMIPLIVRRSFDVVTVSDFSKRELVNRFRVPEGKVSVVSNAISAVFDEAVEDEIKPGPYILAVSSLAPSKNLARLIQAFGVYRRSGGLCRLLVVGAGNSGDRVFTATEALSNGSDDEDVVFLGRVTDTELVSLYRNADLFVHASLYEGFGIPPLEAMSCGTACVVSDIPSLREVCGDAAVYVDPLDVQSISAGMMRVLGCQELVRQMIDRGKERASLFDWTVSAEKIHDVISRHR